MKKLIIVTAILLSLTTYAWAYCYTQTDWTCVNDCMRRGYILNLCKARCSWNSCY